MIKTIVKQNDLELRLVEDFVGKRPYMQLVRRASGLDNDKYYYSLIHWRFNSNGADVHFIGDRPFEYVHECGNLNGLWALMEYGNRLAEAEFRYNEDIKGF